MMDVVVLLLLLLLLLWRWGGDVHRVKVVRRPVLHW